MIKQCLLSWAIRIHPPAINNRTLKYNQLAKKQKDSMMNQSRWSQ